jgi:antitoxin component YwqK of YwqJK toxin-antitoxin module
VTWWYENGQKALEGNYINGEPDGTWNLWDEDGTIKKVENYQNGVRLHY